MFTRCCKRMSKVFTITSGMETMGALKTGGQGSVYKGKRVGEIITAVKLLPTPIHTESEDDKNFVSFKNEVEKLKRVNENPSPNVVKIFSSGITDTGNLPFIEMEFIEGPDLGELLKPPHDRIFTIKEVLKVAEHLSNALAHCHQLDVKHGDIKSNNVKLNTSTGNYVLLDFGLSVMSDESRRTSFQRAGAIEFMAPEQNEGELLFQTDVYSFGVILYELLAGQVPFPLHSQVESARNEVRLAHMELSIPDVLALREKHLPDTWTDEVKQREMQVPAWLLEVIDRCLSKDPVQRFADGVVLQEEIMLHRTQAIIHDEAIARQAVILADQIGELEQENEALQQTVEDYKKQLALKEAEIESLTHKMNEPAAAIPASSTTTTAAVRSGVSKTAFFVVLAVSIALAIYALTTLFKPTKAAANTASQSDTSATAMVPADTSPATITTETRSELTNKPAVTVKQQKDSVADATDENNVENVSKPVAEKKPITPPDSGNNARGRYMVKGKAYFHNEPNESTRRDAFIVHWNNAVLKPLDEKNGFIYVVFTNHLGQTSKGWLRKSDLRQVNE
jgi:eukaryotic-like serine/threonine-protein kinase